MPSASSSMISEPILKLRKSMQTMNMPKSVPNAKTILKAMLREFLLQWMKLRILNSRLSAFLKLLMSTPLKSRLRSTKSRNSKRKTQLLERQEFKITLTTLQELPKWRKCFKLSKSSSPRFTLSMMLLLPQVVFSLKKMLWMKL